MPQASNTLSLVNEIWTATALFWPIVPFTMIPFFVYLMVAFVGFKAGLFRRVYWNWTVILFLYSIAFLGLSIGIMTGWSRSPVVGPTIQAFLAFIGGFAIYAYSTKKREDRNEFTIQIGGSILAISGFLLIGAFIGAQLRSHHDQFERAYNRWEANYQRELKDLNKRYETELEIIKAKKLAEIDRQKG